MRAFWRSVYPPVCNQPTHLSIHSSINSPTHPFTHISTYLPIQSSAHPSTHPSICSLACSPTFLISLQSSSLSPSQFSSLSVWNSLPTGLLASSLSHLASFVHIAARMIFLHFSFLICKIKEILLLWITIGGIIIYWSNSDLLSSSSCVILHCRHWRHSSKQDKQALPPWRFYSSGETGSHGIVQQVHSATSGSDRYLEEK